MYEMLQSTRKQDASLTLGQTLNRNLKLDKMEKLFSVNQMLYSA